MMSSGICVALRAGGSWFLVFHKSRCFYSEFQTANYSEFGILMYNIEHKEEVLEVNQKISGIIGNEIYGKIQFEGVVLRCEKNPLESSMP